MRKLLIRFCTLDYIILSRRIKGGITSYPRVSLPICIMSVIMTNYVIMDDNFLSFDIYDWIITSLFIFTASLPWILNLFKIKPKWRELSDMHKISYGLQSDIRLSTAQNNTFWHLYKKNVHEYNAQIVPLYLNFICIVIDVLLLMKVF